MTPPVNRRAALGALVATATATVAPGVAAALTDPDAHLLKIIADVRHWNEQIGVYARLCDEVQAETDRRRIIPKHQAKLKEAHDRFRDSYWEAVNTPPQTLAGTRALLELTRDDAEDFGDIEHAAACLNSLLASPIFANVAGDRT